MGVQDKLKDYKNNDRILEYLDEEMGVNTDVWMEYGQVDTFELGGKESSLSNQIKIPAERIARVIERYQSVFREVFEEYKSELLEADLPVADTEALLIKKEKMQAALSQAENSGDIKKAIGIQKGINSLERKLENPKKISAWLQIVGEINSLKNISQKIVGAHSQILGIENNISNLMEDFSGNKGEIQKQKEILHKLSRESVSGVKAAFSRVERVTEKTRDILSKTLGSDRAEALMQEVSLILEEDTDHLASDMREIEQVLENEGVDAGGVAEIRVWDRDPDIDLYMGNYTDCCIRIDSKYHRSESPISDYLTDLGMQVVAVYDEKTKKPFAAAWLFVGQGEEKEPVLVVDNIEATGPQMRYKEQIQQKLKSYIEEYAKECGIKKVSQGPHNNDMVIASLEKEYVKAGGYNKQGGYYLEAESDDPFL